LILKYLLYIFNENESVTRRAIDKKKGMCMKKDGKGKKKVQKVMKEFKEGKLHSGSKKGPEVTNPKQGIAIAMSEAGMSKKKKGK
jgi:Family of unknown function (DUF6496)